ncbi:hypothetical protein M0R45_029154 [Rubus argutus]|uniref:Uncharacterized protein n=1 Tax=Rubus argutus TaxID=59490 RepID=A0AAW1W759_RUBAR
MEQARYWMWAKRKHNSLMSASHHVQVPSQDDSSWEEQAFAEDAAGPLGGGHMNVHRRDRARLKQSPNDQNAETAHQDHDHHDQNHQDISVQINPFSSSLGTFHQYPSHHQVCALVYNPSSDPPSSPSRVSAQLPGAKKISRIVESGSCRANKGDYVTTDLSRGLKYLATPSSIEELDLELRLGDRPKVIKVDK